MLTELEIFSKRLKQARTLRQFSMDQLCQAMNNLVSKQAVSKYESAKMMPNSTVLLALCEALDVDLDYFFRPFNYDVERFNVSFRKKSDAGAKDIKSIKVKIQDDIERYLEIEEILGKEYLCTTVSTNERLSKPEQMVKLAQELRTRWMIGTDPIANVQDMLEEKGIKVILIEASPSFDGVSGTVNGRHQVIVLNKTQTHVERRRFTSMHELCHILYNVYFDETLTQLQKERLCDSFANEMLLPSEVLHNKFRANDKITTSELESLQRSYGISISAIMVKLHQLQIVNDSRYNSYIFKKNNNKSFCDFIEKSRYAESLTDRFETMVYSAYAKNLISVSKAASLLQCSINTVRRNYNFV